MNTKHTPGLTLDGSADMSSAFAAEREKYLAAVNAELLAALQALYARACRTEPDHQGLRHQSLIDARAAIAKAEGV